MANNSFLLKGWTATLAAALTALAAKETEARFSILALLPALAFWGLDAYYLRQERLFRRLYDQVRQASAEDLAEDPYSLSTAPFTRVCPGWFRTLWAGPVAGLHILVVGALVAAILTVLLIQRGIIVITI